MKYIFLNIVFGCVFLVLFTAWVLGVIPIWISALFLLGYIILILVLSTNIRLNFFIKAYNHNPYIKGQSIALSFDDGPDPHTLRILEILDQHEVKAVFFCIGNKIEQYPEIFKEIIKQGHIVGNHTYTHTRKMGFLTSELLFEEISKCNDIAEKVGGVKMNLFRPPFGIINPKTTKALERSGLKVVGWTVRPYDAITSSPQLILKRITSKVSKGDVILLHDNLQKTPFILEQLLVQLKRKNFCFLRLDNLFKIDAYN